MPELMAMGYLPRPFHQHVKMFSKLNSCDGPGITHSGQEPVRQYSDNHQSLTLDVFSLNVCRQNSHYYSL